MNNSENSIKSYDKNDSINQNQSITMINSEGEKRECLRGGFAYRAYTRKGFKEV
ncbi:hypothetical protein [Priestia megaterium]|uniref:hypothetical protein n=1 Tax=Priestia megaterium TaxID=1404 RepID=UPI0015E28143|nr:hypothetical protein [Priestia megaterium]